MGDGAQPPALLPDACSSFDLEQGDIPTFSLSRLPNIDSAFTSLSKLPSIDGLTSFTKLPSTDALDFFTNNNNNLNHNTIPMPNIPHTQTQSLPHQHTHSHVHNTATHVYGPPPPQEDDAASAFSMLSPRTVAEAPSEAPPLRLSGASVSVGPVRSTGKRVTSGTSLGIGLASPDAEAKRLQHNRMMRENRERANRKFNALEALLQRCACADVARGPMRNKMQVLDRAMAQYPAMRARRAELRASLVTSALPMPLQAQTQAPIPPLAAPDTLARLLLAAHGWKAAEVWRSGRIHTALLAAKNMLPTSARLRVFCALRSAAANGTSGDPAAGTNTPTADPLVSRASSLGANVWVPDLRVHAESGTANVAIQAQVSTALYVPLADSVVVLFHADDDLLPYPGGVRPYDADTLAAVDELARPLRIP